MLLYTLRSPALLGGSELVDRWTPPPPDATPRKSALAKSVSNIESGQSVSPTTNSSSANRQSGSVGCEGDALLTVVRVSRRLSWHDEHGARLHPSGYATSALRSPPFLLWIHRSSAAKSPQRVRHSLPARTVHQDGGAAKIADRAHALHRRRGHILLAGWAGRVVWAVAGTIFIGRHPELTCAPAPSAALRGVQ